MNDELRHAEQRVARSRHELSGEFNGWVRQKRESLTSPSRLAVVVGVGFVIGSLLRRRRPARPDVSTSASTSTRTGGVFPLLAGLAMTAMRMYGPNPWSALQGVVMRLAQGQGMSASPSGPETIGRVLPARREIAPTEARGASRPGRR